MRRVLFKYLKFILFPFKALSRTPPFFATYLDKDSKDCMFTEAILKAWDPVHLSTCGWYLDCALKRPASSKVTLRESLEPALKSQIAYAPKAQAKDFVKKGGKRKKSTPEATNFDVVVEVASIPEDVEASIVNIGSPSIMKKDEPSAKRLRPSQLTQLVSFSSSNVSTFELLPKLKGMALIPPPISNSSTSLEFILKDSFVRMVEEKQHIGVWPKCYDDIVVFLTKLLIPISKSLICHFPYSLFD
jgi:hypothetical protein